MSCRLFLLSEASVPVTSLDAAKAWLPSGGSSRVVLLRGLRCLPVLSPRRAAACLPDTTHWHQSWSTEVCGSLCIVPIRPGAGLLLSAPASVLSTQGVAGKPGKQGPRSYTTQNPSWTAFLLSVWPGIWALRVGSSTAWVSWSLTSSGPPLPGVVFPVPFSVRLLNDDMARLSSLDNPVNHSHLLGEALHHGFLSTHTYQALPV